MIQLLWRLLLNVADADAADPAADPAADACCWLYLLMQQMHPLHTLQQRVEKAPVQQDKHVWCGVVWCDPGDEGGMLLCDSWDCGFHWLHWYCVGENRRWVGCTLPAHRGARANGGPTAGAQWNYYYYYYY
jgi:hypothetical protein